MPKKSSKSTKSAKNSAKKQEIVEKTNPLQELIDSLSENQKELFSKAVTLAVQSHLKGLEGKITNSILENLNMPKTQKKRKETSELSEKDIEKVHEARSVKDLNTKKLKEEFIRDNNIKLPKVGDNKDGSYSAAQLTKAIREYFSDQDKKSLPLPKLPSLKEIKKNKNVFHKVQNPEKKGDVKKKDELEAYIVVHGLQDDLFEKYPYGGSKQNKDFTVEEYKTVVIPHLEKALGTGKKTEKTKKNNKPSKKKSQSEESSEVESSEEEKPKVSRKKPEKKVETKKNNKPSKKKPQSEESSEEESSEEEKPKVSRKKPEKNSKKEESSEEESSEIESSDVEDVADLSGEDLSSDESEEEFEEESSDSEEESDGKEEKKEGKAKKDNDKVEEVVKEVEQILKKRKKSQK